MSEESQDAFAVIECDKDDAALGPGVTVESDLVAEAVLECSAVYPQRNRELAALTDGFGGSPDIEIKAILAHFGHAVGIEFLAVKVHLAEVFLPWNRSEGVR